MDFNFTDIQQEFISLAKGFGEKKLAPTIVERDHQGVFDEALVQEMLGLGLTGAYYLICFCFPLRKSDLAVWYRSSERKIPHTSRNR